MNPLSKAYQCRPKVTEAAPEKPRAFNSTLAVPSQPMRKIGKRGRKLMQLDSAMADEIMQRDGYECVACLLLDSKRVPAYAVHHIARKLTHKGVDVRYMTGWLVALCQACHGDEHAQRGFSNRLVITVMENSNGGVTQVFERSTNCEDRIVGNYNPFAGDAE